jgi:hypothetical protein
MLESLGSVRVDRLKKGNSSEVLSSSGDSHGSRSRVAHDLTTEDARTMSHSESMDVLTCLLFVRERLSSNRLKDLDRPFLRNDPLLGISEISDI